MTVQRIVTPNRWIGTSAETKPTATTHPNLRNGDTYYAYDTGILYITHDLGTTWTEKLDPSPGVGATSLGKAEDAAHASGDTGVMMLGVRKNIPGSFGADGDYVPPQFDHEGNLRITQGSGSSEGLIGKPQLRADASGWAVWEKIARTPKYNLGTEPNRQFRQGPWAAHLNGGNQNWGGGYDDFASVWIPVNEIKVTDLDEIMFTYYKFLAGTSDVGGAVPNIAIRTHHPDDHDRRAEITDTGAGGETVTEGWHDVIFTTAATAVLYYGAASVSTPSGLSEGTNYTWAQFQADAEFSLHTVYQINIDYGYWGAQRSTGDIWIGSCQINNIPVKWEPADLNDLGTRKNLTGNPFGPPELRSAGNGRVAWTKDATSPQTQKGSSGWSANLYGGVQTGGASWAAVYIPVNELPVPLFHSARWTYYMTNAEAYGVNMVIWVHDPFDFDKRAEITQSPTIATLAKAQYWNAHELNQTTDQFFYYGENEANQSLITEGAANQYGWDDFQGDEMFNTWTVYRVSFEMGWYSTGTFESVWVADISLNNQMIQLRPSDNDFVETKGKALLGVTVGSSSTSVVAANQLRVGVILTNDSDEVMYLAVGETAVANDGFRLNPKGGSFVMSKGCGYFSREVINGICASGSKICCGQEFEEI